jgi:hypothetical protein
LPLPLPLPLSRHSERSEESAFYDRTAPSLANKAQETFRLSSRRGFNRVSCFCCVARSLHNVTSHLTAPRRETLESRPLMRYISSFGRLGNRERLRRRRKAPMTGHSWFHRKVKTTYHAHLQNVTPPELEKPSLRHKLKAALIAVMAALGIAGAVINAPPAPAGPAPTASVLAEPAVDPHFAPKDDEFQTRIDSPKEINSALQNLDQHLGPQTPEHLDYVHTSFREVYKEFRRILADPKELADTIAKLLVEKGAEKAGDAAWLLFLALLSTFFKKSPTEESNPAIKYMDSQLACISKCFKNKPRQLASDIAAACGITTEKAITFLRIGPFSRDALGVWTIADISANLLPIGGPIQFAAPRFSPSTVGLPHSSYPQPVKKTAPGFQRPPSLDPQPKKEEGPSPDAPPPHKS